MYKPIHVPSMDSVEVDDSEDKISRSLFDNGHV